MVVYVTVSGLPRIERLPCAEILICVNKNKIGQKFRQSYWRPFYCMWHRGAIFCWDRVPIIIEYIHLFRWLYSGSLAWRSSYHFIETEWRIYASVNQAITVLDNGFPNIAFPSSKPRLSFCQTNISEIWIKWDISYTRKCIWNAVCKIAAILSWVQCVNNRSELG